MQNFIKMLLSFLWVFFKYPLYLLGILILFWLVMVCTNIVLDLLDGKRFKRGQHRPPKKMGLLYQLFVAAPRAYVRDMFDVEPDYFKYQGLVIYTGRQGDGKTISLVRDILRMQYEYPLAKCITNLAYKHENEALTDWRQLIDYNR